MIEGGIFGGAIPAAGVNAIVALVVLMIMVLIWGLMTSWCFTYEGVLKHAWTTEDKTSGLSDVQLAFTKAGLKSWPTSATAKPAASNVSTFVAQKFPKGQYERSDGSGFTTERLVETRSLAPQWVPSEWSISDRGDNDRAAVQGNTTIDGFANAQKVMAKTAGVDHSILNAYQGN